MYLARWSKFEFRKPQNQEVFIKKAADEIDWSWEKMLCSQEEYEKRFGTVLPSPLTNNMKLALEQDGHAKRIL